MKVTSTDSEPYIKSIASIIFPRDPFPADPEAKAKRVALFVHVLALLGCETTVQGTITYDEDRGWTLDGWHWQWHSLDETELA